MPDFFGTAKKIFWRVANKTAQRELNTEFVVDEENKLQVSQFVAYITGNIDVMQELNIDPRKGVLIMGNPGSGKSMLFRIAKECLKNEEYKKYFKHFNMYNTEHTGKMYMKEGDQGIEKFTKLHIAGASGEMHNVICFDDLGAEEIKNNYGNKKEVMVDIILERYDHLITHGLVTHFTTNLTMGEIEERYSTRIRSRLTQMCNIITLGGSSDYKDRRR